MLLLLLKTPQFEFLAKIERRGPLKSPKRPFGDFLTDDKALHAHRSHEP